ncbi:MAG TPA: L,D-transpeptidase [Elainellaceae cyanobacterium]
MNRYLPYSHSLTAILGSVLLVFLAQGTGIAQISPAESSGEAELSDDLTAAYLQPLSLPERVFRPYYPPLSLSNLPPPTPIFPEAVARMQLVIRLGQRRVYVYKNDEIFVSYPIAVGRAGWETPTGEHEIISMVQDPGWQNPFTGEVIPPGPSNPLGERWIGFWTDGQNYIGFHGTPNTQSVGRAASHGCIRMYNEDVRALFEIVALGTQVIVEP